MPEYDPKTKTFKCHYCRQQATHYERVGPPGMGFPEYTCERHAKEQRALGGHPALIRRP